MKKISIIKVNYPVTFIPLAFVPALLKVLETVTKTIV